MAGNQSNTLLVEVYFEGKDKKRITQTFEFKLIENENEPMIAVRPAPRTYRNISPEDIDMRLVIDEEYNPVSAQVFDRPEKQSKDQLEYVKSSKPNIDSQKSNYSVKTYPESLANKSKESVKKHPYPESSMNTSDESVKQQHKELQLTSESREIAQPILQLIPMYQKPGKLNKNQNVAAGSTVTSSHAGASSASTATKAQYGKTGEKPIEAFYTASQGKGDNLKKTQSLGPRNQEVPGKERYKLPKGYRTPRDYQAKPYTYTAPPSTESREGEKLISRTATQPEAIRINERNCAEMYILNPESEDNLVRTVSVDTPRSKQDRKARVAALNQASEDSKRSNTEKSAEERNPRVTIVSPPSENPTSDANATKNVEKSILTSSQGLKSGKKSSLPKGSHQKVQEIQKPSESQKTQENQRLEGSQKSQSQSQKPLENQKSMGSQKSQSQSEKTLENQKSMGSQKPQESQKTLENQKSMGSQKPQENQKLEESQNVKENQKSQSQSQKTLENQKSTGSQKLPSQKTQEKQKLEESPNLQSQGENQKMESQKSQSQKALESQKLAGSKRLQSRKIEEKQKSETHQEPQVVIKSVATNKNGTIQNIITAELKIISETIVENDKLTNTIGRTIEKETRK